MFQRVIPEIPLPPEISLDRDPSRGGAYFSPAVCAENEALVTAAALIQHHQREITSRALKILPFVTQPRRTEITEALRELDSLAQSLFHSFSQLGLLWPGRMQEEGMQKASTSKLEALSEHIAGVLRAQGSNERHYYDGEEADGRPELRLSTRERHINMNERALHTFRCAERALYKTLRCLEQQHQGPEPPQVQSHAAGDAEVRTFLQSHGQPYSQSGTAISVRDASGAISAVAVIEETTTGLLSDPVLIRDYARVGTIRVLSALVTADTESTALLQSALAASLPKADAAIYRGSADYCIPLKQWLQADSQPIKMLCAPASLGKKEALTALEGAEHAANQRYISIMAGGGGPVSKKDLLVQCERAKQERARVFLDILDMKTSPERLEQHRAQLSQECSSASNVTLPGGCSVRVVPGNAMPEAERGKLASELTHLANLNRYYPLDSQVGLHGTTPTELEEGFFHDLLERGARVIEYRTREGELGGFVLWVDAVTTAEIRPEVVKRYETYGSVGYIVFVAVQPGSGRAYEQLMGSLPYLTAVPDILAGRTLTRNERGLTVHMNKGGAVLQPGDFAVMPSTFDPTGEQQYIALHFGIALGTMVPMRSTLRRVVEEFRLPRREQCQLLKDISFNCFGGIFRYAEEAALYQLALIHSLRDQYEAIPMDQARARLLTQPVSVPCDPYAPPLTHRAAHYGYREPSLYWSLRRIFPSYVVDELEQEGFFETVREGRHGPAEAAKFEALFNRFDTSSYSYEGMLHTWDLIERFAGFLRFQFETDEDMGLTADFTSTGSWAAECNRRGGFRHPEVTFTAFSGNLP